MRRIGKRVDEADRDGLHLLGEQRVNSAFGIRRIERPLDGASVIDALVHDLAQVALDERRRLGPREIVETRHSQGADLKDITESLRGDQADACPLVLEDRVRRDRSAVADFLDRAPGKAGLCEQFGQAIDDRAGVIADTGRHLPGVDRSVGSENDDVGKGAADVDADAECGHCGYSAARVRTAGSRHWTFGTSRHLRAAAISARSLVVSASSTRQVFVSTITP